MHALDILGDPVRRRILEVLARGETTSGDIVLIVGATVPSQGVPPFIYFRF